MSYEMLTSFAYGQDTITILDMYNLKKELCKCFVNLTPSEFLKDEKRCKMCTRDIYYGKVPVCDMPDRYDESWECTPYDHEIHSELFYPSPYEVAKNQKFYERFRKKNMSYFKQKWVSGVDY